MARDAARTQWAAPPEEEMYLPLLQSRSYLAKTGGPYSYLTLVVRTSGEPAPLGSAVREAVWSADNHVAVADVQTMDEVIAQATASPRFYLVLLATFAAVALVLAAVGIYGVMSYSVARRRTEIGIRMALGAKPTDVLRLVMGEGTVVAAVRAAVGVAAALGLTRLMSGLLYGVAATDPVTFAAVCAVLTLVAVVATWLPARRAIAADPLTALRSE